MARRAVVSSMAAASSFVSLVERDGGPTAACVRTAAVFFVRLLAGAVMVGLLGMAGARPAAAQGVAVEVRAGVAASSALVKDEVAAGGGRPVAPVTLRAAPAPVVVASVGVPLRPRVSLEASAGWTFSELRAEEGFGARDVQRLGVGHGVVGVRYAAGGASFVRAGFGGIRYVAEREGIFAGGARVEPLAEVGGGWTRPIGRFVLDLGLTLQAHAFGTPTLEAGGVKGGGAYRALLQVGIGTGGPR
ncbi:MAG TPA: hypothetical protein VFQ38_24430 [Longimicrobiales bacterium]|nr:hypothetical protein [Longimicrobiales bacterium]